MALLKGVKYMQITLLGTADSSAKAKVHPKTEQLGGFADLLSGSLQGSPSEQPQAVTKEEIQASDGKLAELSQWIGAQDISEIENGEELFQEMLSDMDLEKIELISDYLGMTEQELLSSLCAFLTAINTEGLEDGISREKLQCFSEGLHQLNGQEAFLAFIALLPDLKLDQISPVVNQDSMEMIKSLKLYELLSNFEKSGTEQQSLKDLLQKVEQVLSGALKEEPAANRRDYVQNLFAAVSKEGKKNLIPYRQISSMSTPQALSVEEGITETPVVKQVPFGSLNGSILQFQQMSKTEQLVLMLDKSGQPVSSEQLMAQFEKILANSQLLKSGGTQRLFIKLHPDHLGLLKVELIQKDSAIIARIVATNSTAKDILESQLQSLKNAFSLQNIQLDKIDISLSMNQQERSLQRDSRQYKEQEQPTNEEHKDQQEEEFSLEFEEALISTEV